MAGHFKKRRGPQGPNKNEQKVLRARDAEDQARREGLLGARFPSLKQLRIRLTFLDAKQRVLEERALSFAPSDAARFSAPCPGRCGRGAFDFAGKVAETIGTGLASSDSGAVCAEPLYAGSPEKCGCEVRCRMELDYLPAPDPAAGG